MGCRTLVTGLSRASRHRSNLKFGGSSPDLNLTGGGCDLVAGWFVARCSAGESASRSGAAQRTNLGGSTVLSISVLGRQAVDGFGKAITQCRVRPASVIQAHGLGHRRARLGLVFQLPPQSILAFQDAIHPLGQGILRTMVLFGHADA